MAAAPNETTRMVVVGQFAGPHGVRGEFKVRSYTDNPADVAAYGPVFAPSGAKLTLTLGQEVKPGVFLARAAEIKSREDCDAFRGALLSVPRSALPPATEDDEFYIEDLVGLSAVTVDGAPAGKVHAVVNYGAGDVVELRGVPEVTTPVLIPFTKEDVPEINLAGKVVTVQLPQPSDDEDAALEEEPR